MTKNIIPTINISSIVKNGFEKPNSIKAINKIKKACIDIGFFQVTGHGISQKKIKNSTKNYCSKIKSKCLSVNTIFLRGFFYNYH